MEEARSGNNLLTFEKIILHNLMLGAKVYIRRVEMAAFKLDQASLSPLKCEDAL